jgi:hypothetical protein
MDRGADLIEIQRFLEYFEQFEYAGERPPGIGGMAAQLSFESPVGRPIHFEDEAH